MYLCNMLNGVATPRGDEQLAGSSSAYPRCAITTYHGYHIQYSSQPTLQALTVLS